MFSKSMSAKGFLFSFMIIALLSGCGPSIKEQPAPDTGSPDPVTDSAKLPDDTESANHSSESPSDALPEETEADSATLPEESKNGKIYEGLYFDESFYQYIDMPQEESPLIYCEITISNVTNTAFDFSIWEKVMATGETKILVPANTAEIRNGTCEAVYQGEDFTLTFVFPDDENTFPQHLEISGFEQLEGKVYINNTIPGHESG